MELSRPKLDAILQREAGASAPCASLWLLRMTTYYFFLRSLHDFHVLD